MPMKFCRSTLFEAGGVLFLKHWKIYSWKTSMVLTVSRTLTHFVAFEEHMAKKCLAKPSQSLLQLAILGVYMRWINYHSATVNISVFIEQRNIAFQSDISIKTMRFLGVLLSRESWDSRQNRKLGRRAVADLFVVFIAWTSQKASKVHKRLSKLAIALIWNIQSPHEDNRPVTPVKCTISAHGGTGTIYDSCRFDIGRFRVEPTDSQKVSTSEWYICISRCPQ